MSVIRVAFSVVCLMGLSEVARAQGAPPASNSPEGWETAVYPILAWVPTSIGINVNIPPANGDGGGSGDIVDSTFTGAFFAGVSATNRTWLIDTYGLWAAFGGDRVDLPALKVNVDIYYGHAKVGRRIAPDLYVTGGVRIVALKYDVQLGNLPHLSRTPYVLDPLVGINWSRIGPKVEWHASFDGGGFGVGADADLGAAFRIDWKPLPHFGLAAGYNLLYLKLSDSVAGRTLIVKPTVQGPMVGIGLYF
jgi:hypothetical protein